MDNLGYVVAGYLVTAGALVVYVASLWLRAARARKRADAIAARARPDAS